MTRHIRNSRFLGGLRDIAQIFGSASRVANASRCHHDADARDLRRLGVSAEAFRAIIGR